MKGYRGLLGVLGLLCLFAPQLNDGYKYSNTVVYRMYANIAVDGFKKYHEAVMDIYKEVEKSEDQNVVIQALPAAVPDFYDLSTALTTDSTFFANQAVAKYYGKNSVALKPQE